MPPLCLLTVNKVLEKMLQIKLMEAIVAAGDLSPESFSTGYSTIDGMSRWIVLFIIVDVFSLCNTPASSTS